MKPIRMKVQFKNKSDTQLHRALGITEERKEELYQIVHETFENARDDNFFQSCEEITKQTNSKKELFFVSFTIGQAQVLGDPDVREVFEKIEKVKQNQS